MSTQAAAPIAARRRRVKLATARAAVAAIDGIRATAQEIGGIAFWRSIAGLPRTTQIATIRQRIGVDSAPRIADVAPNGVVVALRRA